MESKSKHPTVVPVKKTPYCVITGQRIHEAGSSKYGRSEGDCISSYMGPVARQVFFDIRILAMRNLLERNGQMSYAEIRGVKHGIRKLVEELTIANGGQEPDSLPIEKVEQIHYDVIAKVEATKAQHDRKYTFDNR